MGPRRSSEDGGHPKEESAIPPETNEGDGWQMTCLWITKTVPLHCPG